MWAHSVALVEDAEQPLKPQESSNLLYALAQLGLAVAEKDAHILLNSVLKYGRESLTVQKLWQHSLESSCLGTVAHQRFTSVVEPSLPSAIDHAAC